MVPYAVLTSSHLYGAIHDDSTSTRFTVDLSECNSATEEKAVEQ